MDLIINLLQALKYRTETVDVDMINKKIGINLKAEEMADLLTRMCLQSTAASDGKSLQVRIIKFLVHLKSIIKKLFCWHSSSIP